MNLLAPSSAVFGLRERLRSAESRLRAADTLAAAARACLTSPGWESRYELEAALDHYDHPRLLGAPGRLLTDHRLVAPRAETPEAEGKLRPFARPDREIVLSSFDLGGVA